ncbi:MAG: sigma-70 family RNA polymerase sigma factor, partial [Chitinophagaceae bacterium]
MIRIECNTKTSLNTSKIQQVTDLFFRQSTLKGFEPLGKSLPHTVFKQAGVKNHPNILNYRFCLYFKYICFTMASYRSYSDSELSYLLTQGDVHAFTEIYNRFYGLLFIHASRRLNDDEQAKDVVQQLFESLWIKRSHLRPEGNLSAYLYTAIRNRILDVFSHQAVENKYVESLQNFIDQDHVLTDYRVRERQMKALIETLITQPFDLRKGPLMRVSLLRLAEDEHVLVLVQHHIISDGWSMQVMV